MMPAAYRGKSKTSFYRYDGSKTIVSSGSYNGLHRVHTKVTIERPQTTARFFSLFQLYLSFFIVMRERQILKRRVQTFTQGNGTHSCHGQDAYDFIAVTYFELCLLPLRISTIFFSFFFFLSSRSFFFFFFFFFSYFETPYSFVIASENSEIGEEKLIPLFFNYTI